MFDNKTVLITGATTGIGRFTALHLARLGYHVIATGRNTRALESLAAEAGDLPVHVFRLDVNDMASIEEARARADELTQGRGIDVLVNNAGYGMVGPMEETDDEDLKAQFQTNVFGLMAVTRAFLPAMRLRRQGRIVNVSSVVGRVSLPLQGAYCASKHAVEALSDALRREVAAFGIRVSVVQPGMIKTEFAATTAKSLARYREDQSPYLPALDTWQTTVSKMDSKAPGPLCVARAIARAIRARRPRARYVAPWHGRLLLFFLAVLPTWLVDRIMAKALGLTRKTLLPDGR